LDQTEEMEKILLHNEELHNLCPSPNIVSTIKSGRLRWTGHIAGVAEI